MTDSEDEGTDETVVRLKDHYNTRFCQVEPSNRLNISRSTLYRRRKRQRDSVMHEDEEAPDYIVQPESEDDILTGFLEDFSSEIDGCRKDQSNQEISDSSMYEETVESDDYVTDMEGDINDDGVTDMEGEVRDSMLDYSDDCRCYHSLSIFYFNYVILCPIM